jgi:ABC-type dipeptide/oligopeptide/nickel transport system ATPase subunit
MAELSGDAHAAKAVETAEHNRRIGFRRVYPVFEVHSCFVRGSPAEQMGGVRQRVAVSRTVVTGVVFGI